MKTLLTSLFLLLASSTPLFAGVEFPYEDSQGNVWVMPGEKYELSVTVRSDMQDLPATTTIVLDYGVSAPHTDEIIESGYDGHLGEYVTTHTITVVASQEIEGTYSARVELPWTDKITTGSPVNIRVVPDTVTVTKPVVRKAR